MPITYLKWNQIGNVVSYGTIAVETYEDINEAINLFASLDTGLIQAAQLDEFLVAVMQSENEWLGLAAIDVSKALEDDSLQMVSQLGMIAEDFGSGASNVAVTMILSKCSFFGWSIGLGWSIGDMISNVSSINQELLVVIAYGDGAVCMARNIDNYFSVIGTSENNSSYYECDSMIQPELQVLGQLRIVGEDKYAEVAGDRGIVRKAIDKLKGYSQSNIEEYCKETIDNIVESYKAIDIVVYEKFKDSFLENS